jgi:steroid delta-isomerase-like uncharacterized protein
LDAAWSQFSDANPCETIHDKMEPVTTGDLIRAYFDAFNRNDPEALLATLADDVIHDINEGGVEVGVDAFRRFKAHMDTCYREQIVDLVVFENGNRGAAEFNVDGSYIQTDEGLPPATGQRYFIPAAAFFTVEEVKFSRVTSYYNLRNWIAAVSPESSDNVE